MSYQKGFTNNRGLFGKFFKVAISFLVILLIVFGIFKMYLTSFLLSAEFGGFFILFFFLLFASCLLLAVIEITFIISKFLYTYFKNSIKIKFHRICEYGDEPYSLILDYIFPYGLLVTSFWPLFLHFSFLINFSILILYYIVILAPFFSFWEKLRQWEPLYIIHNFSNPTNVRYFVIGVIYPYIYILLFGIIRCMLLGNLQQFYQVNLEYCIYVICLLFYFLPFIFILLRVYKNFRETLLHHTNKCGYSLHLYLLRNRVYKNFAYKIFKVHFVINNVGYLNGCFNRIRTIKHPLLYNIFWYIWYTNPQICLVAIPIFFITEVILCKQLYFSYYFLFVFFCLRMFLGGFRVFGRQYMHIRYTINESNYLDEKSWKNPDFPEALSYSLADPFSSRAPCIKYVSPEQLAHVEMLEKNQKPLPFSQGLRGKYSFWQRPHISKLPLFRKIKIFYVSNVGRRWVHSSSSSVPIKTIHPMVPRLIHGSLARLCMVSEASNWIAVFPIIQQMEVHQPSGNIAHVYDSALVPESIMQHYPATRNVSIVLQTEHNLRASFSPWAIKKVTIAPHSETNVYANHMKQAAPDLSANFKDSFFTEQNLLAFDQKTTPRGRSLNLILVISPKQYAREIIDYGRFANPALSPEAKKILDELVSIKDVKERMLFYSEHLHLFTPSGQLPPINLEKMVSEDYFSQEYKVIYTAKKTKINLMSIICHNKFPINPGGGPNITQQTINLVSDPTISAILKDISYLSASS